MTHDRGAAMGQVEAKAMDWLIRQRDPAFDDWEAFGDWLGEDPAHAEAYQELAALDADLGELSPGIDDLWPQREEVVTPTPAENVVQIAPRRVSRRAWLGGAIAASLAGIIGIGVLQSPSDSYRVQTALGMPHVVTLADGSEIAVNGGSSVLLSRSDPRRVKLEQGQVLLSVVHSDSAPFRVSVGNAELVDIGTVFDVTHEGDQLTVAVSEGAVVYNPGADDIRIDAGYRYTARMDGSAADLTAINPMIVGGWRGGQLVYDGVRLSDVAAEVARTTGIQLRAGPGASAILFRGALRTDLPEDRLVNDLAALSGTTATKDGGGWTLSR
jgi:transmembrane sensor